MRSRLRKLVIGWNPASEKLCSIRIRDKFYNYRLICAHAPTDETEEGVKDDFYDHLDRLYSLCPSYDTKVLLVDFNAKLGIFLQNSPSLLPENCKVLM